MLTAINPWDFAALCAHQRTTRQGNLPGYDLRIPLEVVSQNSDRDPARRRTLLKS